MSYIFDMEIMTEEKVIDLRPSSILVRTVHSAVDVGVQCEDKPAGMIFDVVEEFFDPYRDDWHSNIEIYTGSNDILAAAIEDHHSAVLVTEVRDFLGF